MNKNSVISISFVIAIASILAASSPNLVNVSVYAQSGGDEDDSSGSSDYEEFVNCLAQSEGDKGFASEDEIRDCFRPIYDPEAVANANSIASEGSNEDGSSSSSDSNNNDDDTTSNTNEESSN
ncbi:hypothetical protein [Candidatus Nitrosocosmicus hydrocola]|jgi:hypothetical protein|uniref:hypothetical protein n=1 Tax=Candidatus Nitrosocosmicus hydrocola TaxID=1826872 RepID=UPI0011E5F94E|nr:hypothetical protein [Candidatus Nitrosocosmicus hydrocola]